MSATSSKRHQTAAGSALCSRDRKEHCHALQDMLSKQGLRRRCPDRGSVVMAQRKAIVERLNAGKVKVLIATGQLIGEGFDCKETVNAVPGDTDKV